MSMPTTRERVPSHTADHVNERIERAADERVRELVGQPQRIAARLRELDAEWDVERAIEANAATLAFIGTLLGFFVHPYWLALPALVTAFLLQHAIQGWCPPVPILRRLGFRTLHEIERERHALKAVRGDYAAVAGAADPAGAALAASRAD
jgi:fatty acid desaturase